MCLRQLLTPSKDVDADVMRVIAEEYAEDYDDVRYYMVRTLTLAERVYTDAMGFRFITCLHS